MIWSPVSAGRVRPCTSGPYCLRIAARHRSDSESLDMPSVLLIALSNPDASAERRSRGTVSSPHVPPM